MARTDPDRRARVLAAIRRLGVADPDGLDRIGEQLDAHPDPAADWARVREQLGLPARHAA